MRKTHFYTCFDRCWLLGSGYRKIHFWKTFILFLSIPLISRVGIVGWLRFKKKEKNPFFTPVGAGGNQWVFSTELKFGEISFLMPYIFVPMSHYANTNGWASSFDLARFKVNPNLNTCLGHIEAEYTIRKIIYEIELNLQVLLVLLQPFSRKLRETLFSHLVISGSKIQKAFLLKNRPLRGSVLFLL